MTADQAQEVGCLQHECRQAHLTAGDRGRCRRHRRAHGGLALRAGRGLQALLWRRQLLHLGMGRIEVGVRVVVGAGGATADRRPQRAGPFLCAVVRQLGHQRAHRTLFMWQTTWQKTSMTSWPEGSTATPSATFTEQHKTNWKHEPWHAILRTSSVGTPCEAMG